MTLKTIKTMLLIGLLCMSATPWAYASDTAIEQAVLLHINQYRHQHGLAPLKMDAKMSQEARTHSIDMAKHKIPFGHKYFQKRIAHLHQTIKNSGAGAENVAFNYKDAQDVVRNWVKSPGHQRNIVGNYHVTGIGIARDKNGKIYFTQIFLNTGNGKKYAARAPFSRVFHKPFFMKNT